MLRNRRNTCFDATCTTRVAQKQKHSRLSGIMNEAVLALQVENPFYILCIDFFEGQPCIVILLTV